MHAYKPMTAGPHNNRVNATVRPVTPLACASVATRPPRALRPRWADRRMTKTGRASRQSAIVGALVWAVLAGTSSSAADEWQTNVSNAGADIVLHWVHVYEGQDTVYSIDIIPRGQAARSLQVSGQPVFNAKKTLLALPDCADDGCQPEVQVVDLVAGKVLPVVKVPETGQVYLTCKWRDSVLRVVVETTGSGARKSTHEYPLSGRR